MGYLGFVQRSTPLLYSFHIYIYNTSTHSVYIDFNTAKLRISHFSDLLCMQLHLSYTPRISYLHTNVFCRLFHSVLMAKFSINSISVKYRKKLLELRHLRGEGKCLSLLTQTSASEKHSVVLLFLCPKANFQ